MCISLIYIEIKISGSECCNSPLPPSDQSLEKCIKL